MDSTTRQLAEVLWDYHNIEQELPGSVDFVLAAGSHDERVAHYAAQLVKHGYAPLLVVSGGYGKVTSGTSEQTEASRFAHIALLEGVDSDSMVLEERASNTGENITLTRELLMQRGIRADSGLFVTKPYMKRRALATALKQWPSMEWYVAGPLLTFDEYPSDDVPEDRMVELMVGDLQRIKIYADKGFQAEQEIPEDVWRAYKELVARGYDRYVLV